MRVVEKDGGISFGVRVVPRASRTRIAGVLGDELRVQIAAPPVEGAANDALIVFFAKALGVARGAVSIVRGEGSRQKTIRVAGVSAGALRALVEADAPAAAATQEIASTSKVPGPRSSRPSRSHG